MQVGIDIQRVIGQRNIVTEVQHHIQLAVGPAQQFGIRRNGARNIGKADLQHNQERQQEQQRQPEVRQRNHQLAPVRHL